MPGSFTDSFLGNASEITMVIRAQECALERLWRPGVGRWQVYTVDYVFPDDWEYPGSEEGYPCQA